MSYRDAIRDIAPGSTWINRADGRVLIAGAAARHVVFRDPLGRESFVLHEIQFRAAYRPIYDRQAIRSQFSMSLSNLGEFRVYWLPEISRIMCRSISCTRHFRVPDGAHEVGIYSAPCGVTAFFDDLDDLIRRLASHDPLRALESA